MKFPEYDVIDSLDHKDWIDEWNRIYTEFCRYHNEWNADYLEIMMAKASKAYYETGDVIMDDQTYDWMENRLRHLRPQSKMLTKVGTEIPDEITEDDI